MPEPSIEPDWIARLRDAGLTVTPAVHDDLPPPVHTLPRRRTATLRGFWRALRGMFPGGREPRRVPHAPVR